MTNLLINEDDTVLNECRVCYDNVENPKKYCLCQGTMMNIHPLCLIKSINENNTDYIDSRNLLKKCEICNYKIKMMKTRTRNSIIINVLFFAIFLIFFVVFTFLNYKLNFEKNMILGFMFFIGFICLVSSYFLIVKYLIHKLKIHEYKITILEYNE